MRTKSGWLGSWVCAAIVLIESACFGDAGPPPCASSDACAAPTPYCHPTLGECVECLSSRNCAPDLACNVATGACVKCNDDADCPQERPYCTANGCAECRTNTNCAAEKLQCVDGKCGSCGDGTCSSRERLLAFAFASPGVAIPYEVCPEDCQDQCVSGTATPNDVVRVEVGTKGLFEAGCSSQNVPDAAVQFTAKEGGTYFAKVERIAGEESSFSLASIDGACPGESPSNCNFNDVSTLILQFDADANATTTLVLESFAPGTFELSISNTPPSCQGPRCGPGGGIDAGAPNDQGKTACLESARDRGEEMCEGVTCACSHCPRDYDDCAIIPGCAQVSECLRTSDCVGQDCFDTGACSRVINSYGGPGAPAFRAASALQSCDLAFSCRLPCGDAGTGSSGSSPDGGPSVCAPGKSRTCACDDGGSDSSGEQTCNEDGSAYADCKCKARAPTDRTSACECGFSRAGSSGAGVAAVLGLAAALIVRRRRHRTGLAR